MPAPSRVRLALDGFFPNAGQYGMALLVTDADTGAVLANVRNVAKFTAKHRYASSASFLLPGRWSQGQE